MEYKAFSITICGLLIALGFAGATVASLNANLISAREAIELQAELIEKQQEFSDRVEAEKIKMIKSFEAHSIKSVETNKRLWRENQYLLQQGMFWRAQAEAPDA